MNDTRRSRIADLVAALRIHRSTRAFDVRLRGRPVRLRAPIRPLAAGAALALVVAACSSAAGAGTPGSTFPVGVSPSPPATMDMSPSASTPAGSAAPGASDPGAGSAPGSPSAAPVVPGSSATTGATLHISAQNLQFDTDHLLAPAGKAFVLEFDNNDPGIPHNVEIKDASGASVFRGQIITGPAKASYEVPALTDGSYTFLCDVHPTMTGTLAAH